MATEIERKFLLKNDSWRKVQGTHYRQGYLCNSIEKRCACVAKVIVLISISKVLP